MDQLICASLSDTHYWYEVGTLKVPALSVHFLFFYILGCSQNQRRNVEIFSFWGGVPNRPILKPHIYKYENVTVRNRTYTLVDHMRLDRLLHTEYSVKFTS